MQQLVKSLTTSHQKLLLLRQSSPISKSSSSSLTIFKSVNFNNRNFSSTLITNTFINKQQAVLVENYLYKNNKIECLKELYRIGLLSLTIKERDFIMKLLDYKPSAISILDLPPDLRNDKEVILKLDTFSMDSLSEELIQDRDVIKKLLESNESKIYNWSKLENMIKNDEELLLLAIKKDGKRIEWASEKLQNKKSIVLMAIKSNPFALELVGEKLKNDKSIVSKAVKINGYALRFASEPLKADPEIVMLAVNSNPYSIQYASDNLKNDPKIALSAIKYGQSYGLIQRGMGNPPEYILESVGKELKKDKDFMIKALKIEPDFAFHMDCIIYPEVVLSLGLRAPCHMVENIFQNKQFTKKYFKLILKDLFGNGTFSDVICKQAANFEDEIRQYVKDPNAFVKRYLEMFDSRESALQYYSHFRIIPEKYRSDRELIKQIFKNDEYSYINLKEMIDPNLLTDIDFLNELMQINPNAISLVSDEKSKWELLKHLNNFDVYFYSKDLFGMPRLLALELVSKKGELLKYLSPDLTEDREIVYKAILNDPRCIRYACEHLQKDKKLIHMIIDKGLYFHDIHPDIQYDFDIMKRVFEINNLPCSIE